MAQTEITLKIDKKLKTKAEKVFRKEGLTLDEAIYFFFKESVINGRLPFDLTPNKETLKALAEVEEMEKHPEKYKTYDSVDELFKDLLD